MRISTSTMSGSLASTGFGGGKFLGKTGEEWGSSLATGAVVGAAALGVFGLGTLAIDMIGGGGGSSPSSSNNESPQQQPCIYMLSDGRMLQVPPVQVQAQVPAQIPVQPVKQAAPTDNKEEAKPAEQALKTLNGYATKEDLAVLESALVTALKDFMAQQNKINAEVAAAKATTEAATKPATTTATKPATEAGKTK